MTGLLILALFAHAPEAPACVAPSGYESLVITGKLQAGEAFRSPFGSEYYFVLAPNEHGWVVEVQQRGREENLARLTPPWHFVPNPRYLEGWHFRNASNTGPNDGSVNAPQESREFYFSPDVGRSLHYEGSGTPADVVAEIRSFGRGVITLTEYQLTPLAEGERASFTKISFEACLIWRAAEAPELASGVVMADKDEGVINALLENGSDISKPHEIDFFFDFDTFESAAKVAQSINREGFSVSMFENEDGTFTIEAKKTMVPELERMRSLTEYFESLTREYGGHYDGWGTEVVTRSEP